MKHKRGGRRVPVSTPRLDPPRLSREERGAEVEVQKGGGEGGVPVSHPLGVDVLVHSASGEQLPLQQNELPAERRGVITRCLQGRENKTLVCCVSVRERMSHMCER